MLKLKANPTFKTKVAIPVPGDKPAMVEFEFRALTRAELQQLLADFSAETLVVDQLAKVIESWAGVDQPYSVEALNRLSDNYIGGPKAIWETFLSELTANRLGN